MSAEILSPVTNNSGNDGNHSEPSAQSALEYIPPQNADPTPTSRIRPQKHRRLPERYGLVAQAEISSIMPNVKEALVSADAHQWFAAINIELETLKMKTVGTWWNMQKMKSLPFRTVRKLKKNTVGTITKYKACLAALG